MVGWLVSGRATWLLLLLTLLLLGCSAGWPPTQFTLTCSCLQWSEAEKPSYVKHSAAASLAIELTSPC